jgi:hypothetical protein
MSIDFNDPDRETTATDAEGSMFAGTPSWDRKTKRRMFGGGKVAPETRTFASNPELDRPLDAPSTATVQTADDVGDAPMATPIRHGAAVRTRKSSGVSPLAIGAAVGMVALIGAAGWYATRDRDTVPTLTPGQPPASEVATAPMAPANQPTEVALATNTLPPPAAAKAPVRTERLVSTTPARTAANTRVRPAARAPSAATSGTNASATLPGSPQPYPTLNPAAPTQVTPAAPPVTSEAAPAAIPTTPPIQAAPTPESTPPTETPTPPSA